MQGNRNASGADSANGTQMVPISPDEIEQFREQAISVISSAADHLTHADKLPFDEIDATFPKLELGVRMLRAVEQGVFPVNVHTLAILEGERDYLARDTAEEEQSLADLDARGIDALAERHDESYRTRLSLSEVLEDISGSREQLARNKRELAIYTGFLNGWEGRES